MDGTTITIIALSACLLVVLVAIWRKMPISAVWKNEKGEFSIKFGHQDND